MFIIVPKYKHCTIKCVVLNVPTHIWQGTVTIHIFVRQAMHDVFLSAMTCGNACEWGLGQV